MASSSARPPANPGRESATVPAGALTALPFGLLVLVGSFLLFQIELVMARLLLPGFGSSASVWTTCLMFYQGALFAGYLYAARASAWIARGGYRLAHVAFVLVPIAFFPFRLGQPDLPPVAAILVTLTLTAGVPFLALSTTSVVCQAWFTTTRHPKRSDPYFLYGLSNAGALAALLSYPFLIEPAFDMQTQLRLWYAGYVVYALINLWCVRVLARDGSAVAAAAPDPASAPASASWSSRMQWLLLSAGANALLMVVTSVISMDAPVPLIWILPLTIYLLTLIICFAPKLPSERTIHIWTAAGLAIAILLLVAINSGVRLEPAMVGLQNMILFVACLLCHDRLVRSKPAHASGLGGYYLAISLGGWVGSILMAVATPLAFGWLASYAADYIVAGSLILAAFAAKDAAGWIAGMRGRPLRIVVSATAAVLVVGAVGLGMTTTAAGSVYGSRTFYGLYRVEDATGLRRLYHGNTAHGVESLDPARRGRPLAYYHPDSPIGHYLTDSNGSPSAGIVGLGVGALAAYRRPGQAWDYYEIDPEVERIARKYFTFLEPRDGQQSPVILGDARLSLQKTPDARYDVLVMDTFSSDFVPLHLVTREAVSLYMSKLKPGGVLFFHISNRLFDLDPILTRIGHELGLRTATATGQVAPEVTEETGCFPSIWYAMTADGARHEHLVTDLGWSDRTHAADTNKHALWTDGYVNLFQAMK